MLLPVLNKVCLSLTPSCSLFSTIIFKLNTADGMAELELCVLCENPADVKFEPCGHITMCSDCADRAKRCPVCKVQVP